MGVRTRRKTSEPKSDFYYRGLTKPGYYFDGRDGLYMQVSRGGTKSWICKFTHLGKRYEQGLGSYPKVPLATARRLATKKREQLDAGVRPIGKREERLLRLQEERASEIQGKTFKECAEAYIKAHTAGWKNPKHAGQWQKTLETYAYPHLGDVPVSRIAVSHVLAALEPIWTRRTETASRVRGRMESVLDWAKARGYRAGENPAAWRGHLDKLLARRSAVRQVKHHEALPYQAIPQFIKELRTVTGVSAAALEFLILTAARTSEALNATWSEFELERDPTWVVPGSRMKAKREHRVPLSTRAVAIIKSMPALDDEDGSAYVFSSPIRKGKALSDMSLLVLVKRLAGNGLTTHGFRSSFRDWASEKTNFPGEVVEMALAHTVRDKVEAAYRRGDLFEKRRKLMQAWSDYSGSERETARIEQSNNRRHAAN